MRVSTLRGATLALASASIIAILGQTPVYADTAAERLEASTTVLKEIMATPDSSIPQDLLDDAHCVVIIPNEKKAGFIVGAKYGRGYAVCRKQNGVGWGAPGAVRIEGGSFGLQIGGASTDIVMLVMGDEGMKRLLEDKFTIGGDVSAAAGPVGRDVSARTDAQLSAKILTWSRSRGVFGGVSLDGSTLRNDTDANKELYGKELHNSEILMKSMTVPTAAKPLIAELDKLSPREKVTKPTPKKG